MNTSIHHARGGGHVLDTIGGISLAEQGMGDALNVSGSCGAHSPSRTARNSFESLIYGMKFDGKELHMKPPEKLVKQVHGPCKEAAVSLLCLRE